MELGLGLAALVILIGLAAYLAASETALMRVSRIRVRYLVEKNENKSKKLENLIENPDFFLPPLLLTALFVQMISASLATWLTTRITNNAGLGVAVGTIVITTFMFIFGELLPKAIASHESEKVALSVTRPISLISRMLNPLTIALKWIADVILKLIGKGGLHVEDIVRDEGEIKAMISAAEESAVIEKIEEKMIHSVFEFGDSIVREVITPRPDMVTLKKGQTIKDALLVIIKNGFSRIPVYGENKENIVGILYAKDLLENLQKGQLENKIDSILRDAYFVPETKPLSDLLKDLQKRKVHLAVVVDEYGTVVGLVTIEDLLEEIVGEIFDEYDKEVVLVEKTGEKRYRVDARVSIDDLNDELEIYLPKEEEIDTIGGLVFKVLGHVPAPGETFRYNGVVIKVERVRKNRIYKVMLEILDENCELDK
ncbi:MAG: HlyC/CorC family transporter [Actinobacteria bacterium]|nr:HlyC/CorC family transporter [Actinomycetota bacterium]